MKKLLFLLAALAAASAFSQTSDQLVSAGRTFLAAHDITNAHARFSSAVAANSNHAHANFFLGITRLLRLPGSAPPAMFLDRLGISPTNRDIYAWSAMPVYDTNHHLVAPPGVNANEAPAFYRSNALPEIMAAEANFARITNQAFSVALTAAETTVVPVTVDYGDVLLVRSLLKVFQFAGYSAAQWNVDMQLTALQTLANSTNTTAESVLQQFPQLFTVVDTSDLAASRSAFAAAVDLYLEASAAIRARPPGVVRLFNLGYEQLGDESRFRTTILDLKQSLNTATRLTVFPDFKVNLGSYFGGAIPSRALLPQFHRDRIVAGTFPDLTFGGIISGLSENELEGELARHFKFATRFDTIRSRLAHQSVYRFSAAPGIAYALQSSTNLSDWEEIAEVRLPKGGVYEFVGDAGDDRARFYRLADLSQFFSVRGHVRNGCNFQPVSGASLQITIETIWGTNLEATVQSDAQGDFFLQTRLFHSDFSYGYLNADAPGYEQSYREFYGESASLPMFATDGTPADNTTFDNRTVIPSVPYSVQSIGCAEERWWSFTADRSGPILLTVRDGYLELFEYSPDFGLDYIDENPAELRFIGSVGRTYAFRVHGPSGLKFSVSRPPLVSFTSPAYYQRFVQPDIVPIGVTITPGPSPLAAVRFFADGQLIGISTNFPFQLLWQPRKVGTYTLRAEAEDITGQSSSARRQIHVSPENDVFSRRFHLTNLPVVVEGSFRAATFDNSDPDSYYRSVWWEWTAPTTAGVKLYVRRKGFGSLQPLVVQGSPDNFTIVDTFNVDDASEPPYFAFQSQRDQKYQLYFGSDYYGADAFEFELRPYPALPIIVSPADGARFAGPTNLAVTILAGMTNAEGLNWTVLLDGQPAGEFTNSPISFVWTNVGLGQHTVAVGANDLTVDLFSETLHTFTVQRTWPSNDDFENASPITNAPAVLAGSNVNATKQPGEPDHADDAGGASVWWTWTAPISGPLTLTTAGSSFDTILAVYTGDAIAELSPVASDDDGGPNFTSRLTFNGVAGTTYRIAVDGWMGAAGQITLSLSGP